MSPPRTAHRSEPVIGRLLRSLVLGVVICPVVFAAAGCSTDGAAATPPATVTVERTVTVTVAAPVAATDDASADGPSASGAAPSDGIPERADACAVLTRTEAQTVVARRLQEAAPAGVEFGKATYCTYAGYPEDPGVGQIEVFIGDGAKKALEIDRDTLKHEFRQIDDLGQECWAEDGQIFFRQGATWASIRVVTLEDDPQKNDRLEAAARIVSGRLP